MVCCGKVVCGGCMYANDMSGGKSKHLCPFCRTPLSTSNEETMKRLKKRIDAKDAEAMCMMGSMYYNGQGGQQNLKKALEYWHQSAELGFAGANCHIGNYYGYGSVRISSHVMRDKNKAKQYYELGAIMGDPQARHNLGCMENNEGNIDRANRHWLIAVGSGYPNAMKAIQTYYSRGAVTKAFFEHALHVRQAYVSEIRSVQRDEAAAASARYEYLNDTPESRMQRQLAVLGYSQSKRQ